MKKITLILLILFTTGNAEAQVYLPNGGFEKWNSFPYDAITAPTSWPWISSNLVTLNLYGVAGVSKVPGFTGQYAVRLETKQAGNDIVPAFISNTDNIINSPREGVPYYFEATSFHGKYRYNIMPGDTAYIRVTFRKNGTDIVVEEYYITGQQLAVTDFSFPVTPKPSQPDRLIISAASSRLNPIAGSWIELDSLIFSDGIFYDSVPEGGFEYWMPVDTYDRVDEWVDNCHYNQKVKTTDRHSGNYALQLMSQYDPVINHVHAAHVWIEVPLDRIGADFPNDMDTLTGYYKYSSPGPDRGAILVSCQDKDKKPIGNNISKIFTPTSTFTYFEIPLVLASKPEFIMVSIASSDYNAGVPNVTDSSTLIIDDLKLKNPPTGVGHIQPNQQQFTVYPNPVNSMLYLDLKQTTHEPVTIILYDLTGRIVADYKFDSDTNGIKLIPVNSLIPGLYHFKILNGESISIGKFLKE